MEIWQDIRVAEVQKGKSWQTGSLVYQLSDEDWDRNHASEQAVSQAQQQSATKAVPDSTAKVVGLTSEIFPKVQNSNFVPQVSVL